MRDPTIRGTRITISDNGVGIALQARTRLFEPFFSTKGSKGTGVGLWVSRSLITKHGGAIRVKSSTVPGHSGTMFSVFIPFKFESTPALPNAA
jgi:signal transduction histidine kinase